jgi:hypothetical protein
MREDLARGLKVRIKRVDNTTEKGNRSGTLPELEGAQKDVARATDRLTRARMAHALATRDVQEYADSLKALGGTPELPEGFQVYVNPEAVQLTQDLNIDALDSTGSPVDPEREPEPNDDDDDQDGNPVTELGRLAAESDDSAQPRQGGRFARRGVQV